MVNKANYKNVFEYGAREELLFERMAEESGYERKTTFYSDLSIAEWYGVKSIKDTYNNIVRDWKDNVEYFTEFVLSLNWKSWEWNDRGDDELVTLYSDLYYKARDLGYNTFKGKALEYFWRTLD